jgi:hypothetical protein
MGTNNGHRSKAKADLKKFASNIIKTHSNVDVGRMRDLFPRNRDLNPETPLPLTSYRGAITETPSRAEVLLRAEQLRKTKREIKTTLIDKPHRKLLLIYIDGEGLVFEQQDKVLKETLRSIHYSSRERAIDTWRRNKITWVERKAFPTVPL